MAGTTLSSIKAERTNRALLVFSGALDPESFDGASGSLVAADAGAVPALLGFEAVDGHPEQALAAFSLDFREVALTFSWSGLADAAGDPTETTSGTFAGMAASGPRLTVYDQRLDIDLGLDVTPGGDMALQVGDNYLTEQAIRECTWQQGALLEDRAVGVPFSKDTLVVTRKLNEYRVAAERRLSSLRGVRGVKVLLKSDASGVLRQQIRLQTDQTMLDVSSARLTRGR